MPRPPVQRALLAFVCVAAFWLGGCATKPGGVPPPPSLGADGPPDAAPRDVLATPDAVPRVEPIRQGGPNNPYSVLGESYTPRTGDEPVRERGLASWYGRKFHGRRTASGELYDMYAMTAAHRTLPIPSYARVRNPANGREVVVRVNDRGPFHRERIIDLSYSAAARLGLLAQGSAVVEVERLTFEQIRTGSWKRADDGTAVAVAVAVALPAVAAQPGVPIAVAPAPVAVAAVAAAPPAAVAPPAVVPPPAAVVATAATTPPLPDDGARARALLDGDAAAALAAGTPPPGAIPSADPGRAYTQPARGFWVQIGAFAKRQGAEDVRQKVVAQLQHLAPLLAVFSESALYRLQVGPYPTRSDAHGVAQSLKQSLRLAPMIVERR
ncbi:MAG: septal ring lytic transglycosylase RlpA family protein [Aquabacterium sp.]|nr:MAG: septal ring lytic transglycosylase RlpA family protein [Aquabacterium sp.]